MLGVRCGILLAVSCALVWGSTTESIAAPAGSAPQPEIFGGWTLTCPTRGLEPAPSGAISSGVAQPLAKGVDGDPARKAESRTCLLSQRLSAQGSQEIVFAFSVLPATKKGQFAAILSVPLGGYLAPGMEIRVDKGRPFKVLFETCHVGGCHGGFELSGRILKEMQTGKDFVVRLWTAKNTPVDVRVDLNGFGPGFAGLRERS